jgi:class 3 adenylate cyclase
MKSKSLKTFSGLAVMIDLRNFSEVSRRLLIQKKKPFSNTLKWRIYEVIFDFLSDTMETIIGGNNDILFDFKHTGDGFLLVTKHHRKRSQHFIDGFLLLLDIYLHLDRSVPELNTKIIDLLENNPKVVSGNRQLRYIENLFTNMSGTIWRKYIDFSMGAHCGAIFYKTYGTQKVFLGNTINQASRFQALSKTFSDYNLFFSQEVSSRLGKAIKDPNLFSKLSTKWFKDLDKIEIKGFGPTAVKTIERKHVASVKEKLIP